MAVISFLPAMDSRICTVPFSFRYLSDTYLSFSYIACAADAKALTCELVSGRHFRQVIEPLQSHVNR